MSERDEKNTKGVVRGSPKRGAEKTKGAKIDSDLNVRRNILKVVLAGTIATGGFVVAEKMESMGEFGSGIERAKSEIPGETPSEVSSAEKIEKGGWPKPEKNFRVLLTKYPALVKRFIDEPNGLMRYLPRANDDQREASRELIGFIMENKNEPWAQSGINKLKQDVDNGDFRVPNGLSEVSTFYKAYFPNMPLSKMASLGWIVKKY